MKTFIIQKNSKYCPFWVIHFDMRCCHWSKHWTKSSLGIAFRIFIALSWMSSTSSNLEPFKADFSLGNSQKSHGARSGEYGGWSRRVMDLLAKNWRTLSAACALEHCRDGGSILRTKVAGVYGVLLPWAFSESLGTCVACVGSCSLLHEFLMDDSCAVEKTDEHCLDFRPRHSSLSWSRRSRWAPLHALPLCFRIVLVEPRLITGNFT